MKPLRIIFAVSVVAMILVFGGLVSALNADEASVSALWLTQTPHPGETVSLIITFSSQSSDQLSIMRVGLHFDWMAANEFYTNDLSSNPLVVPGMGSQAFETMSIQIPPTVSAGSHSYYVGIDGVQGGSQTPFSWDSNTLTVQLFAASGSTPTPTGAASASPTPGHGDSPSLLVYFAVVAIAVIVVLVLITLVVRRKRKPTVPVVEQPRKESEEPVGSGDFNI